MQHQRFAFLWTALSTFILIASISCATAFAQDTSATIWPTKGWQTSTPEEQGMSSVALARLLDFGKTLSFDSLLIARHGKIVLDAYYDGRTADLPHQMNSATKAVIGTLAAIAYKDGLLDSLNHPVLEFFGDRSIGLDFLGGRSLVDFGDKGTAKAITVQSLIDGEAIVSNESGLAVFEWLRSFRHDAAAVLCAFDLLERDGEDWRRNGEDLGLGL